MNTGKRNEVPLVRTRTAWADPNGQNHFCGRPVLGGLTERASFWSLLSLAVGGPEFEEKDARVLDVLAAINALADPRIWPMKIARLLALYGNETAGALGAQLCLPESFIGPFPSKDIGHLLMHVQERTGGDIEAVRAEAQVLLGSGRRIPGLGVPGRPADERVTYLKKWIVEHDRSNGTYCRLAVELERATLEAKGIPANIGLFWTAVALDLGLKPEQLASLLSCVLLPTFLANACESAQQGEALLQRFPQEFVEYVGAPARKSPRAAAAENGAGTSQT